MTHGVQENVDAGPIARGEARYPWLPFAGIYTAYGATFGVVGGGAPLVLRAHGVSLYNIGLLQLIYVPIGLAFVWAPLVDRFAVPYLPHRIGWIIGGMGATAGLLALLGLAAAPQAGWAMAAIFALAAGVSVTMTTADIALEALIVETVASHRRPFVTTAKLTGSSLGTMIGVGLATAFPQRVGLPGALMIVAALDAVLILPVLAYPEPPRRRARSRRGRDRTRVRLLFRRAAVLGFFFAPAILIVSVPNLVLLDLKLSLPSVGFFTGTLTTAIGVAMTLAAGAALTRIAAHRIVAVLACGVAASGLLLALATWLASPPLGYAAAIVNIVFEGGLGVPVFNMVYKWAEGEHAATDYALLFGIAFLVSFPARVVAPMLGAAIGWPTYFLVSVPVYVVAVAALVVTMRDTTPRAPA